MKQIWIIFLVLTFIMVPGRIIEASEVSGRAVPLLRKYCQACHGLGELRFLVSEFDSDVWDYLFNNQAPSGEIWAKEIVRVLDWPTNSPPSVNSSMGLGRDWMPKGKKRYDIVNEKMEDGRDVRQFLRDSLQESLPSAFQ